MPDGCTMTAPDQPWLAAAAAFLGMWIVMMAAMMLPTLVPMLRRYRASVETASRARLAMLTATVTLGYFVVWTAAGAAAYPVSAALAGAVPVAAGAVIVIAGTLQFTAWKARHLACCREASVRNQRLTADTRTAWRHGVRLGIHCCCSCLGLTIILLAAGMMDLRAMAAVTAAIASERLAPGGARIARIVGLMAVGAGLWRIAHTI